MTEIPEHLLRRAEAARQKAAEERCDEPVLVKVPETPLNVLPGEPFDPPLSPDERERIAVAIVNMRVGTDQIISELLENAKEASENAKAAHADLTRRHRVAVLTAVVGTVLVCVLLGLVIAIIAVQFG